MKDIIDTIKKLNFGALQWTYREYEIHFSLDDYCKAKNQMEVQDEKTDDIILLKIDYNILAGKVKIVDKIRMAPQPTPNFPKGGIEHDLGTSYNDLKS